MSGGFVEQKDMVICKDKDRIKVLVEKKPHSIINNRVY